MLENLTFLASASVETHAATGGFLESIAQLLRSFHVQWSYFAVQVISFAILAFVLYRFGLKPVLATMDERTAKIESGLKYAAEMKQKLEQAQKENEELLRKAALEAQAVVNEARKTAKELAERQSQETTAQTAAMLAKAQQSIELERKKMLSEVRAEIARLVTLTTGKVLAKELTADEKTRYTQAATRELTGV